MNEKNDEKLPPLAILVAAGENGVIGQDGHLPWHLPDEMRLFKQLTLGHTVVMGRKTWESLKRPLPGRRNVVLTRQPGYEAAGADVLPSFEAIAALEPGEPPVFVIGGVSLIEDALPVAEHLHLTRVHASPEGDTFLPPIDFEGWELVEESKHERDERHEHAYTYQHWKRKS